MKSRFDRIPRLDVPLRVAVELYDMERHNEPAWFTRVVQRLDGILSYDDISNAFDMLQDFGVISGEYGAIEHGRAAYRFSLTEHGHIKIEEVYNEILTDTNAD